MQERNAFVETADGKMETFIVHPDEAGPYAPVVMYQNVSGLSDSMRMMARRVAAQGYYCVVPDLYYRLGKIVIDADSAAEHVLAIRNAAIKSLRNTAVMEDTRALLKFIQSDRVVRPRPAAVVGYCMGGRFSLLAAAHFPSQIAAAASLFGVGLITDAPDSPHLMFGKMRGEVYCGFAEHDPFAPPEFVKRFTELLERCNTVHSLVEVHPGSHHGYAFPGRPTYQKEAAERSWERIFAMFGRQLSQ